MQYHEPRNPSDPPDRVLALTYPYDIDRQRPSHWSMLHVGHVKADGRISRKGRPQTVSIVKPDHPTGLRRLYGPSAVIGEHMIIPDACFLYPSPDRGRRLGKAAPTDQFMRNPVKGDNCISTDMFVKPTKRMSATIRPDLVDHVDLTQKSDLRPARLRKAPPQLNPIEFQRVCESTRLSYKTAVMNREKAKILVNPDNHDMQVWL